MIRELISTLWGVFAGWDPLPYFIGGGAVLLALILILGIRKLLTRMGSADPAEELGFAYDEKQGIFYSELDAWQRDFGFCSLYDAAAPTMAMIIDCEPVRFSHGGKDWMIELWKGQYGVTTGGEMGVYVRDPGMLLPGGKGGFYRCADDTELLNMRFTLWKGNRRLFARRERHWWVTGFAPGEFSQPGELVMRARIDFADSAMCRAFTGALEELGYHPSQYWRAGGSVEVVFGTPRTAQPLTRRWLRPLVQRNNKRLCQVFRSATGALGGSAQGLEKLREERPDLYRSLVGGMRSQKLYRKYNKLIKQ